MPALSSVELLMLGLVITAGVFDLAIRKIPNKLLAAAWITGLGLLAMSGAHGISLLSGFAGATLCFCLFLPFYLLRGMAAGDVKLIATLGFLAGPADGFQIAMLTWCAGGVMAVLIMVFTGTVRTGLSNMVHLLRPMFMRALGMPAAAEPLQVSAGSMPYGLAIALGTLVVLWQRHN